MASGHVLILVENLPVPLDRRVWMEATTLEEAGYDVTVVCPATARYPAGSFVIDGIAVERFTLPVEGNGAVGLVLEYAFALLAMVRLAFRVHARRPVHAVHLCNPPDLLFLVALALRVRARRLKVVFDHHDLSPELVRDKGMPAAQLLSRVAQLFEWLTFRSVDRSIATNESYRRMALTRGGMRPEHVHVVRSGPRLNAFDDATPDESWRNGREFLVGYVGVMGKQEGLPYLIDAIDEVVRVRGLDTQFVLVGDGPERRAIVELVEDHGLSDRVTLTGRLSDEDMQSALLTSDVCVNPDEVNEMNDLSTMNKVVEYMALGRPVVQFDTREGRVSAQDAAVYAAANDGRALGAAIADLLEDPERREEMGRIGRKRFEEELHWERGQETLLALYDELLSGRDR